MNQSDHELAAKHLWNIGNKLASSCASASRYYISNLERNLIENAALQVKGLKRPYTYCNHCGSLWAPGNHKVRVQPLPSVNRHLKKLLKLESNQPWKLNVRQKKNLRKFHEATNKIIYTCLCCKKKTSFPGLKKYVPGTNVNTSTPMLKIKPKREDLNAGLYISTPPSNLAVSNCNETLNASLLDNSLSTSYASLKSSTPVSSKRKSKERGRNTSTAMKSVKIPVILDRNKSMSKKKRQSLVTSLHEEQPMKKKSRLSDFLVSL